MSRRYGFWLVLGILTLVLTFGSVGVVLADDKDQGDRDRGHRSKPSRSCNDRNQDNQIPPQTLATGFESTDSLECDVQRNENAPEYSAWLVESSRFVDVPSGSFMPDRAFIDITVPNHDLKTFDFPANYGIIKGPDGNLTLYDSGWMQDPYIYQWNNSCCGAHAIEQMNAIGLKPENVIRIVLGHGHWDHAGQLSSFPQATVYIQNEELKQIDFFIDYPTDYNGGHIRAVNTVDPLTGARVGPSAQACARTPVCGYPPQTLAQITGKQLAGKLVIVDGRKEIAQGLIIHPAFRGHIYGSQLLQVHTRLGELVFGSDTYSSWEGIRDWNVANVQQTDTIQQFLAYEKCYVLTARDASYNNCLAAHERLSYSKDYPITKNWWTIPNGNCSRAAELTLAKGEKSLVPNDVETGQTTVNPGGPKVDYRISPTTCRFHYWVPPTPDPNPAP